ncbi:Cyclin-dependent kinase 3 [Castilleja foliolosa]|uniref:Cyclin-dependent kinase 3 n=1 Tax=Castilleja foliolosa TaxID=1961234 RepID=A0ABD3BXX5_9LAMI
MDRYQTIERIERGGYGVFYKCLDLQTNEYVVKKMIPYESKDAGVPYAVLNEISMLMELNHENIVRLRDVYDDSDGFHLIFELLELDLSGLIHGPQKAELKPHVIKSFLFQILQGVSYCHAQKVMHGDLKPQNLLVDTKSKTVKLFGFGLTMTLDVPLPQYTTKVGTVSYQAPEILLGTPYSRAVDIWSVGCIFAEMVGKNVLFEGLIDTITMSKIISVVGLPDEEDWPGVTEALLKFYGTELPDFPPPLRLSMVIPGLDPQGLDLLTKMLSLNPKRRITAWDALNHPYFEDLQVSP